MFILNIISSIAGLLIGHVGNFFLLCCLFTLNQIYSMTMSRWVWKWLVLWIWWQRFWNFWSQSWNILFSWNAPSLVTVVCEITSCCAAPPHSFSLSEARVFFSLLLVNILVPKREQSPKWKALCDSDLECPFKPIETLNNFLFPASVEAFGSSL